MGACCFCYDSGMKTTFTINDKEVTFDEWWDNVIHWNKQSLQRIRVYPLEQVSILQKDDGTDLTAVLEAAEAIK